MDESGNSRTENNLFMNGPEIFNFTLRTIPPLIRQLLTKANLKQEQVDMWVFHQANQYMLEHLRKKLGIAADRFAIEFSECGNTVSSTIPIALSDLNSQGRLKPGQILGLVGFGVGYSWGASIIRWQA
jgi:3-oxoacyl-[acyl-carrier-protein] synthase-3